MKIMSLNLFGFVDWSQREPNIVAYIERHRPDVILFQEVVFLPEVNSRNQVQLLNQKLGYNYEHSAVTRLQVGIDYPVYREGLAALSRYSVTTSDVVVLKQAPDDRLNRIVQLIDVHHAGTVYKLANVHFSEYLPASTLDKNAALHLVETLELLAARDEERFIIGDFNMPDLKQYRELWQANYVSSAEANYISYPSDKTCLDYALVPKSYRFRHIEVSPDQLSDHRALLVDVEYVNAGVHLARPDMAGTGRRRLP